MASRQAPKRTGWRIWRAQNPGSVASAAVRRRPVTLLSMGTVGACSSTVATVAAKVSAASPIMAEWKAWEVWRSWALIPLASSSAAQASTAGVGPETTLNSVELAAASSTPSGRRGVRSSRPGERQASSRAPSTA